MSAPVPSLIDTDILSALMRKNHLATERARSCLQAHRRLAFSVITRYEVLRGLLARRATAQLAAFDQLCAASQVVPLTDAVIVRAATVYADLHQRDQLIGDADILIAATAITHGLAVITNNKEHFKRIPGIRTENWLAR